MQEIDTKELIECFKKLDAYLKELEKKKKEGE